MRLLHQLGDLVAQDRLQLRGVHILVPCDAGFDAFDDLHGGFHAYVGGDEHLLQIVEHLCIDGRSTGNGPRQFREEARFGLLQTGVEFRLLPVSGFGQPAGERYFPASSYFRPQPAGGFPEKSVEIVPPESSAVYSVFS